MSIYITVAYNIYQYLKEYTNEDIFMKMHADGDNLVISFEVYDDRSYVSKQVGPMLTRKLNLKGCVKTSVRELDHVNDFSTMNCGVIPRILTKDRNKIDSYMNTNLTYTFGDKIDVTPDTIKIFSKIIVKFSHSSRGAYDSLYNAYHIISDNVNQNKVKEMLAHICNPRVHDYKQTSLKITGSTEFLGDVNAFNHKDEFCLTKKYGHFYKNFTAEIEIR